MRLRGFWGVSQAWSSVYGLVLQLQHVSIYGNPGILHPFISFMNLFYDDGFLPEIG